MKIQLTHAKNPAVAWNVDVSVTAENTETIAQVRVRVNGVPGCDDDPEDNTTSWHQLLTQQGQYPGENRAVATVTDQKGNETRAQDRWQ